MIKDLEMMVNTIQNNLQDIVVMEFVKKLRKNHTQMDVMMIVILIEEDQEEKLDNLLEDQVMHLMYLLKTY